MYPISLDLSRIRITLVGTGELLARRLAGLKEAGATQVTVYDGQLPEAHAIRQSSMLMVVGLDDETSVVLASIARLQGILVNVEDKPDFCDFHFNSFIKRGDLTIAISTGGTSPTLSQEIRTHIAGLYGEEWADIVSEIGAARLKWKRAGLDNKAVGERTREWLAAKAPPPLKGDGRGEADQKRLLNHKSLPPAISPPPQSSPLKGKEVIVEAV